MTVNLQVKRDTEARPVQGPIPEMTLGRTTQGEITINLRNPDRVVSVDGADLLRSIQALLGQ
jgi:hypothetical protein